MTTKQFDTKSCERIISFFSSKYQISKVQNILQIDR